MRQVAGGESRLYILGDLEKVTQKHFLVSQNQIRQNAITRNNCRRRAGKSGMTKGLNKFAKVKLISAF